MRAVLTVIGKDMVGILAKVSTACAQHRANIIDVNQTVLQDLFAMVMLIDIRELDCQFSEFQDKMGEMGKEMGMDIHCMHENIFNSMHKI